MIDLHCHVLPALDDGPVNVDFSVAMARAAAESGTQIMVATPHIRSDYRFEPASIEARVEELNAVLADEGVPLRVVAGAEVALRKLPELSDQVLGDLCLGSGPYLLVESPYRSAEVDLEGQLGALAERGFSPMLAHPERCPLFHKDPGRLGRLVAEGVLCSVTAGSMEGRFGEDVRRFAIRMFREALVHDVASDAHDHVHRPPALAPAFARLEAELPGLSAQAAWYTVTAPVAVLAGRPLPPRPPPPPEPRPSRWRRVVGRLP